MNQVTYLRTGRKNRATGTVTGSNMDGWHLVTPEHAGWGDICISDAEIQAAKDKPKPRKPMKKKPHDTGSFSAPITPDGHLEPLGEPLFNPHSPDMTAVYRRCDELLQYCQQLEARLNNLFNR